MESQLIKLTNKLKRKRLDYIKIQGTFDKNGRIKTQLIEVMTYDDEYDYYITLTSGQFSSIFPDIVKNKNDKFYYLKNDVLKTLTLTKCFYNVKNINAILQQKIPNEAIKLVADQGSAKCQIILKQEYKIDCTNYETFKDILGFGLVIVNQPFTESPKLCDLFISTYINIHFDVEKGSIFQRKSTNIVYSFLNNIAF